jgi:hypothetical protein
VQGRTAHERDPDRLKDVVAVGVFHLHHF